MTRPLIVATGPPRARAYRTAGAAAVSWVIGSAGCGVVCRGPACEDDWDLGRLLVLRGGGDPGEQDAADAADSRWTGTAADGVPWSVGLDGDDLWVGLPAISTVARQPYAAGVAAFAPVDRRSDDTPSGFGHVLGVAPRADGTGSDLWIGNPEADLGAGRVSRLAGPLDGTPAVDGVILGAAPGDHFGETLAVCPDLGGDGEAELLVAAPWFAPPADFPFADPAAVPALGGAVFLLDSALRASGDPTRPWTFGAVWWADGTGDDLGAGLACDRDLDGDGAIDLVFGAPLATAEDSGRFYVLPGSPWPASGPVGAAARHAVDGTPGAWLGASITTIRLPDRPLPLLVVGAPGLSGGAGGAWLFASFDQPQVSLEARFEADEALVGDHVGRTVGRCDLDGDGVDDLLLGAPDYQSGNNGYGAGRAFAWMGPIPRRGIQDPAEADRIYTADQPFARIGQQIACADLDQDGRDDLVLPARTAAVVQPR